MSDQLQDAKELRAKLDIYLKLLENRSKTKLSKDQRNQLLENVTKLVMKNPGYKAKLADKDFIKQITMTIMIGMTGPDKFQNIAKTLSKILENNDIDLQKILKMKGPELKKYLESKLNPKDLKEFKEIIDNISKTLNEQLNKFNIKLMPDEQKAVHQDVYQNLFGLLNSSVSGGLAFPVQTYLGNGLGINDWNPNHGDAQIDAVNKVNDTLAGDPQGLNASTLANYAMIEGNPFAATEQKRTAEAPAPYPSHTPLSTKYVPPGAKQ